jgi:hypothetical protein
MSDTITPYEKSAEANSHQRPLLPDTRARISRRDFQKGAFYILGGSALFAALARLARLPSALQRIKLPDITRVLGSHKTLERSIFVSHLGDDFQITRGATLSIEATLVEVTGFGSGHLSWIPQKEMADPEQVFSMLFRGPRTNPLEQETYLFHHRDIGWLPLFIVPISRKGDRIYYEAIVNRLSA